MRSGRSHNVNLMVLPLQRTSERMEYYRQINESNPAPGQLVVARNRIDQSILMGGLIAVTMFAGGTALATVAGETLLAGSLATAAASTVGAVFTAFERFRRI